MHVDYTKYFSTADELVTFLLLDNEEQDRRLAKLIAEDEGVAKTMSCDLEKRREDHGQVR